MILALRDPHPLNLRSVNHTNRERVRETFFVDLVGHLADVIEASVSVSWVEPDSKAGCVRFGLSDGRVGDVKPGDVGGWENATIYVSGA